MIGVADHGGRGEARPGPGCGFTPHTAAEVALATELRGLCQPAPTGTLITARRGAAVTTSSSSAARADDPNTFGLGDLRLGDVVPEPEPDVDASPPTGRAMGVGRVIGPGILSAAADGRLIGGGSPAGGP